MTLNKTSSPLNVRIQCSSLCLFYSTNEEGQFWNKVDTSNVFLLVFLPEFCLRTCNSLFLKIKIISVYDIVFFVLTVSRLTSWEYCLTSSTLLLLLFQTASRRRFSSDVDEEDRSSSGSWKQNIFINLNKIVNSLSNYEG